MPAPRSYVLQLREHLSRETGFIIKDWGGKIRIGLVYPNRYDIGLQNLGFQLVYHLLNREPDVVCERFFLPSPKDSEEGSGIVAPLSLESQSPLNRFEVLVFSTPFENDYPHIPQILAASGIPMEASRRRPPHPLVLVGGVAASLNPEPLAMFVDVFAIGEAEDLIADFVRIYRRCRDGRLTKKDCLELLTDAEGMYVPAFYEPTYDRRGRLQAFRPRGGASLRIRRRVTRDLSQVVPATRIFSPTVQFGSLSLLEISRGCPHRCRFCAVGHIFRPARHRPLDDLLPHIREGLRHRERVGLVSSSVCDHPQLDEICGAVASLGGKISPASVRLDRLGDGLLGHLVRSGHRSLSLAPETGSQRLRALIGKPIPDDQILETASRIAAAGIPAMRLYFMVGLPSESWEDVDRIPALARKCLHAARKHTNGRGLERLTLSVNPFIPKPATPLQWHPFLEPAELKARIQHIRKSLKGDRCVHVVFEPPKWSRIQALLSRGDRRVGRLLALVGAGRSWEEALRDINLNPDFYLHRQREAEELLPWDFIDHGVAKSSLWRSYQQVLAGL